jgi:hypothetical protein
MTELHGNFQFSIVKDGIESYVDLCPELMSMRDQMGNIRQAVGRGSPGTKLWPTNIDCIGAMIYGTDTADKIFGRSQ